MKPRMIEIIRNSQKYNSENMAFQVFGLDSSVLYDALVVAPGWKPTRIVKDPSFTVTVLAEHSYISGYLVEKDGLKIAWIQISSSASNLIDHLTLCAELQFKRLIFVGAVGSLKAGFQLGDLCVPTWCVSGVGANAYLCEKLTDYRPFGKVYPDEKFTQQVVELAREHGMEMKKASVFCTDSVCLEYSHLDEIRSFGTDLIEMETSSFYLLAQLMEKDAVALLIVSDNSATGEPLIGRDEAQEKKYDDGRKILIPQLIYHIAKM